MYGDHISLVGAEYYCTCCQVTISKKPKDIRQHLSGKQHKAAVKGCSADGQVLLSIACSISLS
jgi:hypothetical protein